MIIAIVGGHCFHAFVCMCSARQSCQIMQHAAFSMQRTAYPAILEKESLEEAATLPTKTVKKQRDLESLLLQANL